MLLEGPTNKSWTTNDRIWKRRNTVTKWNSGLNKGFYENSCCFVIGEFRRRRLCLTNDAFKSLNVLPTTTHRRLRWSWSERRRGEGTKTQKQWRRFSAPWFVYTPFWSSQSFFFRGPYLVVDKVRQAVIRQENRGRIWPLLRLLTQTKRPTKTEALYSEVGLSLANSTFRPGVVQASQKHFWQERSRDIAHRASHQRIEKEVDKDAEPSPNQQLLRHLRVLRPTTNTTRRRQP